MAAGIQKINDELMKLNLEFSFDGISVKVNWLAIVPDDVAWVFTRHMHESFEFHIIPKGKCSVAIDGKEYQIRAGELYIVPPGVYHTQASDPDEIAVEYGLNCSISVDPDNEELRYISFLMDRMEINIVEDKFNITRLYEQIIDEIKDKRIGYYFRIKLLIYEIIIGALRSITNFRSIEVHTANRDIDQIRVVWIEAILSSNLSSSLSLNDLSKLLYLSERQINRVVRKVTGKTCHQFILNFKIQKAKEMLYDFDMKVSEIADSLGFANYYHFSNTFKSITGNWPTQYRKILRENDTDKTP